MLPNKDWDSMTPKERLAKPWLEPTQMALAQKVLSNAAAAHRRAYSSKPRLVRRPETHCSRGHARTAENLRVYRYGNTIHRQCVPCLAIRHLLRREKKRRAEQDALGLLKKYGVPLSLRQVAGKIA